MSVEYGLTSVGAIVDNGADVVDVIIRPVLHLDVMFHSGCIQYMTGCGVTNSVDIRKSDYSSFVFW